MSEARAPLDETPTQAATRTGSAAWDGTGAAADPRVLGLTVLYHPDVERVGERAVLGNARRGCELSRQRPEFAAPGAAAAGRPLADLRLSRTPIVLVPRADGGVELDRQGSPITVSADGREVATSTRFDADEVERGVVLLLGGRVVLLLHRLDPLVDTTTPSFNLVGASPAVSRLRRDIVQIADLTVPVLLRGESGTGKELVARAVHAASPRRDGPFEAVNMAALPPSLAAAELFGAEKGAFTGADRRRPGLFERAAGGTLFLDEVGETPIEVQALLLRCLETGEVHPVGGGRRLTPDVRILSATDADLESAVEEDRFRAPLLHRLSGYVLRLPPLRQRREDFGRLFVYFLRRELRALGQEILLDPSRPKPWLPASLVARLAAWTWPGNVRQVANVVRQAVIANRHADPAERFEEIETLLRAPSTHRAQPEDPSPPASRASVPVKRRAADLHEDEVIAALRACRFQPAAAADALGIPRPSIYDLMKKIPGLRKAADLSREDIDESRRQVGPSLEAMAEHLEVSERALRRRLGQLHDKPAR